MKDKIYSSNPAVDVLKRTGASGKFLVLTIMMTVSVAVSIAFSGEMSRHYSMVFSDFFSSLSRSFNDITGASIVASIFISLPTILVVVAMWMIFFACSSRKDGGVSTSGITLLKVIKIIELVIFLLASLALLAIGILFLTGVMGNIISSSIGDWYYYYYGTLADFSSLDGRAGFTIFGIIFCVIAVLMCAFVVAFYTSIIKILSRGKNIAETGVPDNRVSGFLIAVLWIFAIIQAIIAVVSIFSGTFSFIPPVFSCVTMLLAAILLSEYKKGMTAVLYGAHPVMAAPEAYSSYAPQVPQAPVAPVSRPVPSVDEIINEHLGDVSVNPGAGTGMDEAYTYRPAAAAPTDPDSKPQTVTQHEEAKAPANFVKDAVGDLVNEPLAGNEVSLHSGIAAEVKDSEDQANMAVEETMKKTDAAVEEAQKAINDDVQAAKENITSSVEDAAKKVDDDLSK